MTLSGIAALNAYSFEILVSVGLTVTQASLGNVAISFSTVVRQIPLFPQTLFQLGIFASSMVVDRFGRRPLLLYTFSLITVINLLIVGCMVLFNATQFKWLGFLLLVAITLFNFVFASGPGPVSLFITCRSYSSSNILSNFSRTRRPLCPWSRLYLGQYLYVCQSIRSVKSESSLFRSSPPPDVPPTRPCHRPASRLLAPLRPSSGQFPSLVSLSIP